MVWDYISRHGDGLVAGFPELKDIETDCSCVPPPLAVSVSFLFCSLCLLMLSGNPATNPSQLP